MRTQTGLRTWLYSFKLTKREKAERAKNRLKHKGTVTEVFVNNGLAFEFTKHRTI